MSAPAKVITNGVSPTLARWNIKASVSGPDEITFTAHDCPAYATYAKGDAVPGYSNMRIVSTRSELVPGSLWDISCEARGLITGSSRIISRRTGTDTLGWDTLSERRMELASQTVPEFGGAHPSHSAMKFMQAGEEEQLDLGDGTSRWVVRERNYRGLATGAYKRTSRKVTVNENVTTQDSITVSLPGGWDTARKGQVSLPRIVVTDTVLTTTAPPTATIPGNLTPPSPPNIQVISVSGSDLTYNWPSAWKLASIDSDELFLGAGVYLQALTYEYVWPTQF
jgi:hypothetical protein